MSDIMLQESCSLLYFFLPPPAPSTKSLLSVVLCQVVLHPVVPGERKGSVLHLCLSQPSVPGFTRRHFINAGKQKGFSGVGVFCLEVASQPGKGFPLCVVGRFWSVSILLCPLLVLAWQVARAELLLKCCLGSRDAYSAEVAKGSSWQAGFEGERAAGKRHLKSLWAPLHVH